MEDLIWPCWAGSVYEAISLSMNASCFGVGRYAISLLSIEIIVDTIGLSLVESYTHNSPTCMHLNISIWKLGSHIAGSTKAILFSSFHNFHAWMNTSMKDINCKFNLISDDLVGDVNKWTIIQMDLQILQGSCTAHHHQS